MEKELAEARQERDHAIIEANSLRATYEEEQKRFQEERVANEVALDKTRIATVEVFLKSKGFNKDLGELTTQASCFASSWPLIR